MLQLSYANKKLMYSVVSTILMLSKEITIALQIMQTTKKTIESNL